MENPQIPTVQLPRKLLVIIIITQIIHEIDRLTMKILASLGITEIDLLTEIILIPVTLVDHLIIVVIMRP